jgi:hypothetical protein
VLLDTTPPPIITAADAREHALVHRDDHRNANAQYE